MEPTGTPALELMAKIVAGVDKDNAAWNQRETAGLRVGAVGLRHLGYQDDHRVVAVAAHVYDALYDHCQEMVRQGKPNGQRRESPPNGRPPWLRAQPHRPTFGFCSPRA